MHWPMGAPGLIMSMREACQYGSLTICFWLSLVHRTAITRILFEITGDSDLLVSYDAAACPSRCGALRRRAQP